MQLFILFLYIITFLVLIQVEHMICSGKSLLSSKNSTGDIKLTEVKYTTSPTKYEEVEIEQEDNQNADHSGFNYFKRERMANRILLFNNFIKYLKKKTHKIHSRRNNKGIANYFGNDEFDINLRNLHKLEKLKYNSDSSEFEDENSHENQNNKQDKLKQLIEELLVDYIMFHLQAIKNKLKEINID